MENDRYPHVGIGLTKKRQNRLQTMAFLGVSCQYQSLMSVNEVKMLSATSQLIQYPE